MRQYRVNTARLAEWLVPAQLRIGAIYAFIKVLLKSVQTSFDTLIKQPATVEWMVNAPHNSLYSWVNFSMSVWDYIVRFWRVNSSLLIARVALANYISPYQSGRMYDYRFVINHNALSGYTSGPKDFRCWWDSVNNYERIQVWYGGNWVDDRLQIKDGLSYTPSFCALVEEVAISTQLPALSTLSEGEGFAMLLVEELEGDADVIFEMEKAKFTSLNLTTLTQQYIGDAAVIEQYNNAMAALAPYRSFGRTFKIQLK